MGREEVSGESRQRVGKMIKKFKDNFGNVIEFDGINNKIIEQRLGFFKTDWEEIK